MIQIFAVDDISLQWMIQISAVDDITDKDYLLLGIICIWIIDTICSIDN